jgi:hypothetical protein
MLLGIAEAGGVVVGDEVAGESVAKQFGESAPLKLFWNSVFKPSAAFFSAMTEARPAGSAAATLNAAIEAPKFGGSSFVVMFNTISIVTT